MRNKPVKLWEKYDVRDGKIERKNKLCPKCGDTFLANHNNRLVCGKCGYMESKN